MKKTVMVGMSGGVDSSVAAALLLEQGYNVVGVTLNLWSGNEDCKLDKVCCSLAAVEDARRVCDVLGIPFYVLNMKEQFETAVVDYFVEEYLCGRTPNPCIACNRFLKFGAMLEKARAVGADCIATGHYAVVRRDPHSGRYLLCRGADASKDQTYVLYAMTQDQLAHTLFPLGGYAKPEVRRQAERMGLAVASKPDSQDICFVEGGRYAEFIAGRVSNLPAPGNFVDRDGNVLGRHGGLHLYTIGQRSGLGISAPSRLYVTGVNAARNEVVLGGADAVFGSRLTAGELNFIPFDTIKEPLRVQAKIRYNAPPAGATVYSLGEDAVSVAFDAPVRAVTPGQAVVFYQGDVVVGGGTILSNM